MITNRVLILSDDLAVTDTLKMYLEAEGLLVDACDNKEDGLRMHEEHQHDLVIVDMALDDCDIIEFSGIVREVQDTVVIILTPEDKQLGIALEVVKKAKDELEIKNIDELLFLIDEQFRKHVKYKCNREENGVYHCGDLKVDMNESKIYIRDELRDVSELTVKLLVYLVKNQESYQSKKEIYQKVWNNPVSENDSTVMAHIRNLRKALEDDDVANPKYIHTKRGVGYMFKCDCCEI
jgi:two-component system response regulator VicR